MKALALLVAPALLAAGCSSAPPQPADPGRPFRDEGAAALAEGNTQRAIASYYLAVALDAGDVAALRGLLDAQVAAGDARGALTTLEALEAASAEPVDPCPGLAAAAAGRPPALPLATAEEAARRARAAGCAGADPVLARVLDARAFAAPDPEQRLALRREAIDLDPGEPARYGEAARELLAAGRVREARSLLSQGLERHPDDRGLRDLMVRALAIR